MIIKAVLVLTMTICSGSQDMFRDKIKEMQKQGWEQSGPFYFQPCEGWNTEKNGIYEEGQCVTLIKKERIKKLAEREK